mmetsp:Transcript_13050/g.38049  ORF Transcript_13050/g.38049 Transcript_13050/m.38049 type:complete len:259 (+) Transcript_13050:281-1057(+)
MLQLTQHVVSWLVSISRGALLRRPLPMVARAVKQKRERLQALLLTLGPTLTSVLQPQATRIVRWKTGCVSSSPVSTSCCTGLGSRLALHPRHIQGRMAARAMPVPQALLPMGVTAIMGWMAAKARVSRVRETPSAMPFPMLVRLRLTSHSTASPLTRQGPMKSRAMSFHRMVSPRMVLSPTTMPAEGAQARWSQLLGKRALPELTEVLWWARRVRQVLPGPVAARIRGRQAMLEFGAMRIRARQARWELVLVVCMVRG